MIDESQYFYQLKQNIRPSQMSFAWIYALTQFFVTKVYTHPQLKVFLDNEGENNFLFSNRLGH